MPSVYGPLIEEPERWVIPLSGRTVTQLRIDYAFSLQFLERWSDIVIRIGVPFLLARSGEHFAKLAIEPDSLCPALCLHNKVAEFGYAYKDGRLDLRFTDGTALRVETSQDAYEAWELSGSRGLLVVSLGGGSLAVWQPQMPA